MAWSRAGAVLLALCAGGTVWGQATGGGYIYSCTDANGKRITRDRYIIECNSREQRVLNPDGSLHHLMPPTLTAEESAVADDRAKNAEIERIRQRDAEKRDQNLLNRYPNEPAHRKARELALEDVRKSLRTSEQRLATLAKERKPLTDDAEFYVGKPLPFKLKLALDANDALVDAQQSLMQNQKLEIVRIDKLYDDELERLRKLWSGARPGSLGPLAAASAPPSAAAHR
jgi:hypothetical protein